MHDCARLHKGLMEQEFYSIKELAVVFAVHHTTIRRAIKHGFIIAVRVGDGRKSPYRISKKSIEAIHIALLREFAEKRKVTSLPSSSHDSLGSTKS